MNVAEGKALSGCLGWQGKETERERDMQCCFLCLITFLLFLMLYRQISIKTNMSYLYEQGASAT